MNKITCFAKKYLPVLILAFVISFMGFELKPCLANGMNMDPDIVEQIAENFHDKASQ